MISWYTVANNLGVGVHSHSLMAALDQLGQEQCLFPIFGQVHRNDVLTQKWLQNQTHYGPKDPAIMNFHIPYLNQFHGTGKRLGFAVFETDYLSPLEQTMLNTCEVLVPSRWGQTILENYHIQSTIVHEGVDLEQFTCLNSPKRKMDFFNETLKCLHVGKWEARKSSKELLTSFVKAATAYQKKVCLTFHAFNPFMSLQDLANEVGQCLPNFGGEQQEDKIIWTKDHMKIILPLKPFNNLNEVYNTHHLFFHASRGEAWNLPLIEALATGLPCLTTNVTGHAEYLDHYPTELTLEKVTEEVANDGVWFKGDKGHWFKPNEDEIVEKMTWMMSNAFSGYNLLEKQQTFRTQVEKFTWLAAGKQLLEVIKV